MQINSNFHVLSVVTSVYSVSERYFEEKKNIKTNKFQNDLFELNTDFAEEAVVVDNLDKLQSQDKVFY